MKNLKNVSDHKYSWAFARVMNITFEAFAASICLLRSVTGSSGGNGSGTGSVAACVGGATTDTSSMISNPTGSFDFFSTLLFLFFFAALDSRVSGVHQIELSRLGL